jgi:hypothetical protein
MQTVSTSHSEGATSFTPSTASTCSKDPVRLTRTTLAETRSASAENPAHVLRSPLPLPLPVKYLCWNLRATRRNTEYVRVIGGVQLWVDMDAKL